MDQKVYKFPNLVKPVRGYKSSVILDLHRSEWYIIPNSMYDFITQNEFSNIEKILINVTNLDDREIIKEYFDFLLENELIFEIESDLANFFLNNVPKFDEPELITNTVLYLNLDNFKKIKAIFSEIEKTRCKYIQLKLDFKLNKNHLSEIESLFFNTSILSVEIIINELDGNINEDELLIFIENVGRIKNLCIHKSPYNKIIRSNTNMDNIIFLESAVDFNKEYLGLDNFVTNTFSFAESLNFNLYFNKKLYIDALGNIKNSNFSRIYGNIFDDNLVSIINSNEFQSLWNITKDQIDICSHCEFRNICIDYRIPIAGKESYYYENSKVCKYNPYIAKWQNEEGWISVEQWRIMNLQGNNLT